MKASWLLIRTGTTYIATGTIYSRRVEYLGTNPANLAYLFSKISTLIMKEKWIADAE